MSLGFNVLQLLLAYFYWLVGQGLVLSLKKQCDFLGMFTIQQVSRLRQL